jgi:hypothetical protein
MCEDFLPRFALEAGSLPAVRATESAAKESSRGQLRPNEVLHTIGRLVVSFLGRNKDMQ